jgi:hypothetical protein
MLLVSILTNSYALSTYAQSQGEMRSPYDKLCRMSAPLHRYCIHTYCGVLGERRLVDVWTLQFEFREEVFDLVLDKG